MCCFYVVTDRQSLISSLVIYVVDSDVDVDSDPRTYLQKTSAQVCRRVLYV